MNYLSFPNKGKNTLLTYTSTLLYDDDGRLFAKGLIDGTINPSRSEINNGQSVISGKSGFIDAILYFRDGQMTDAMADIFKELNNRKNITKDVQGDNNPTLSFDAVYGSFVGFVEGDTLGWSFFGDRDIDSLPSLAITQRNEPYALGQGSYSTELMMSLINNIKGGQSYNPNVALTSYIKCVMTGDSLMHKPQTFKMLLRTVDPLQSKVTPLNKYKGAYKRYFGQPWDNFFDKYIKDSADQMYGGCFSRIVPLALTMQNEPVVMDTWMTDPYVDAFQAMNFIVDVLRLYYLGHDTDHILSHLPHLTGEFIDVREHHLKGKTMEVYDTDNVYVTAMSYALMTLLYDQEDVINACTGRENSGTYHVYYAIIMSINGARVGMKSMMKDPVLRSNAAKIQSCDINEGINVNKDNYINNELWSLTLLSLL